QADYWEVLEQCWLDASTGTGLKGFQRKLQELRYALQVEKDFSKNDILLGYLNISSFGGQTYGIEAAANLYFGLSVGELSTAQAALLVGMVQEPNTYRLDRPEGAWVDKDGVRHNGEMDGYASARDRRDYVLDMMLENGKITASEHRAAIAEPIVPNLQEPQA